MECIIREWKIEDVASLAEMLNNKNILDNLRDGLPYPYTKSDAEEYITSMLSADKTKTFAFVYFGDWIKDFVKLNLVAMLLLVHAVYVGIRVYVNDCKRARGYY